MQGGRGAMIAEPEVDRVRRLLEGFGRKGNACRDIGKEGRVFGAEVVVFFGTRDIDLVVFALLCFDRHE